MKKLLIIFALFIASLDASTQLNLSSHVDIGSSTISSGVYGRPSAIVGYRLGDFKAQIGLQAMIGSAEYRNHSDLSYYSGMFADLSRDFKIKEFPFNVSLFMKQNQYSTLINEWNFGFFGSYSQKHLEIHFGMHSRIYAMGKEGRYENADPDVDLRIYEYRNFMYKGIIWLHEVSAIGASNEDYNWNVGISLTNFDHFLIQQETNPMLTALFQYKLQRDVLLFSEIWYQGAGMLNLAANYYGFYIRAGIKWQIEL